MKATMGMSHYHVNPRSGVFMVGYVNVRHHRSNSNNLSRAYAIPQTVRVSLIALKPI
jgi:NAD dependent epimerase/dehydratase family